MYIIELFFKIFEDLKKKKIRKEEPFEYEKCDHTFFPIDSTGKVLACSKCGEILKVDK